MQREQKLFNLEISMTDKIFNNTVKMFISQMRNLSMIEIKTINLFMIFKVNLLLTSFSLALVIKGLKEIKNKSKKEHQF